MILTRDQLANWTINEIVRQFPATVTVFKHFGIDACCGGALPVSEAARRHGAGLATLLAELQHALATPGEEEGDTCAGQCQLPHNVPT